MVRLMTSMPSMHQLNVELLSSFACNKGEQSIATQMGYKEGVCYLPRAESKSKKLSQNWNRLTARKEKKQIKIKIKTVEKSGLSINGAKFYL